MKPEQLLQIREVLVMTWKTKAISNYIVSAIFLALMIIHIVDEKSVLRIIGDVIPLIWFGLYASFCMKKHFKTKQ